MGQKTVSLGRELEDELIGRLPLKSPHFVTEETPLRSVLAKMRRERTGCVLITAKKQVVGIFTERDMLTRVIEAKANLSRPIAEFMTANPEVLSTTDTMAHAVQLMYEGGYRHLPVMRDRPNGKNQIIGLLSVRDVVRYFGSNFPAEVYNLPPDPKQTNRAREGA